MASSGNTDAKIKWYKMDSEARGKAVIIGNGNFGIVPRNNSDLANMKALFKFLGFKVEMHEDKTCVQMKEIISKVADMDRSQFDCFALVLLVHGKQDKLYGTDGEIPIDTLLAPLKQNKCKPLIGKPKLIFIQAYQCEREGAMGYSTDADEGNQGEFVIKIPMEADYLYSISTVYENIIFGDNNGSWYVQALKEVFETHGDKYDINHLLISVNDKMIKMASSDEASLQLKIQVASTTSQLTKSLSFPKL